MTEHELTEEKIAELWDANAAFPVKRWGDLTYQKNKDLGVGIARDAYNLGKASALKHGSEDDGFIDCEVGDIQEGDTVERTFRYSHGTVVTTVAVVDRLDSHGRWLDSNSHGRWLDSSGLRIASGYDDATYRRKPAPITPPDPEKHPIILDEDGDAWVWRPIAEKYECLAIRAQSNPEHFGNNWRPAKVVAKEED